MNVIIYYHKLFQNFLSGKKKDYLNDMYLFKNVITYSFPKVGMNEFTKKLTAKDPVNNFRNGLITAKHHDGLITCESLEPGCNLVILLLSS